MPQTLDVLKASLTRLADREMKSRRHPGMMLRTRTDHIREDLELFSAGVLDRRSLFAGYKKHPHPVEVAFRRRDGKLYALRRQHNLQTTQGRNAIERVALFGDIAANQAFASATGTATATTATSLTNSGAAFPTTGGAGTGLIGREVWAVNGTTGLVFGVITAVTATVLTVDQWYNPTSTTGAAGTTPAATALYSIGGEAETNWIGLSTAVAAAAAADVLRTADGLFGDGTTGGAATEQTANGLARVYVLPTFPSSLNTQLQNTWTYTTTGAVTIGKVVLCNSKAVAGSLLNLETLLSATGTVSASGDTIQVTWTITD